MATGGTPNSQARAEGITFAGQSSASDNARQHVGNVYNNYAYQYTLRKRRSDETLLEDQRNTALLRAAAEGQAPRVRYLMQLGLDLDHSDDDGFYAIHHAALSGFEDVVDILLEAGADVNAKSLDCGTPLHLAALKGRSNVVERLLAFRANVNATSRMLGSPLHCASLLEDSNIASALIQAGAEVANVSVFGYKALLRFDPTIRPPGYSNFFWESEPLVLACTFGNISVVSLLLDSHARVNAPARLWGSADYAQIAFDDAQSKDKVSQRSALVEAAGQGHEDVCRILLQRGASINAQDSDGSTALLQAAGRGHARLVGFLVENNAALELRSTSGFTALRRAAKSGQSKCLRLLCRAGAAINDKATKPPCDTALHRAAMRSNVATLRVLIEEGAEVNILDDKGQTPLHYAAESGRTNTTRFLLQHGADPSAKCNSGKTALDRVRKSGSRNKSVEHEELCQLLETSQLQRTEAEDQ